MKKFLFDCGTRDTTASVGILVLRLMFGSMMLFGHGLGKLMNFPTLKETFELQIFPFSHMPNQFSLAACLIGEVLAPVLLVLGIATRPAAFLLGFTMVVAAFHVHGAHPMFPGPDSPMSKEPALLYLVAMISLIFSGGGAFSFDSQLYFERVRRRW